MTALGLSEAACVIIGNSIGDANPKLAWKYFKLTSGITLINSVILTTLLIIYREDVSRVFTTNESVLQLLYIAIPYTAGKYTLDAYQGYLLGPIRALGK